METVDDSLDGSGDVGVGTTGGGVDVHECEDVGTTLRG